MPVPRTADEITPEWLTVALREGGHLGSGAVKSVSFVQIGQGLGFASSISRGIVEYEGDADRAPASLVVKMPSADESVRTAVNRVGLFQLEARVYTEIGRDLGVAVPELLFARADATAGEYILVLEDLSDARLGDQVAGCTVEEARAVIENLARLHARWWDSDRLRAARWLPGPANAAWLRATGRTYRDGWRRVSDQVGPRMPAGIREIAESFGPRLEQTLQPLGEQPATFIHGDCRLGNLFFRADEVVLIDFQLAAFSRGAVDLAYFIQWSFPVERRRQYEKELLRAYYDALRREGVDGYTYDTLVEDYRRGMFQNLTTAIVAIANLDFGSEIGQATVDILLRGLTGLVDWDCAELIPE